MNANDEMILNEFQRMLFGLISARCNDFTICIYIYTVLLTCVFQCAFYESHFFETITKGLVSVRSLNTLIQLHIFSVLMHLAGHRRTDANPYPYPFYANVHGPIRSRPTVRRSEGCVRRLQLVCAEKERVQTHKRAVVLHYSHRHAHVRFNFHLERSHKTQSTSKCT